MMKGVMTMRRGNLKFASRAAVLACLGAMIVAPLAWSQSIETGAITGFATDEQGAALPGVTINVTSPEKGTTVATVSDASGRYRIMSVQPGTYTLEATLDGFRTARQSDVVVNVTKTLTVDFTMQIGAFEDVIEVQGAPLIDTQDSKLATMEIRSVSTTCHDSR